MATLNPSFGVQHHRGQPAFRRKKPFEAGGERVALVVAVAMALTIVGTVFGGKIVALASIVPLVLAILFYAGRDMALAVALLLVYLAMEGMYKYLTSFSQAIYVIRPLMMLVLFWAWRSKAALKRVRVASPPMHGVLIVLIGWGIVELANPYGAGLVSGAATLLLFYIGPILFYWIGYNAIRTTRHVQLFCCVLVAACTIVSAFTAVQFWMGRGWTEAHLPGYSAINQSDWFVLSPDQSRTIASSFRPASTTSAGGGGCIWSSFGVITALGLLSLPSVSLRHKLGWAACLVINVLGAFLSGVRLFVFVAVFEAFLFLLLTARTPREVARSFLIMCLAALLAFAAFWGAQLVSGGMIAQRYADTASDPLAGYKRERGGNIEALWNLLAAYPIGSGYQYGLGYMSSSTSDSNSPNSALSARNGETQWGAIAGDMGVPGLILLVVFLINSVRIGWRSLRRLRDPNLRVLAAMLLASLVGYVLACFGGPALQGTIHFWFIAGMLAALPAIEKRESPAFNEPPTPKAASARSRRL